MNKLSPTGKWMIVGGVILVVGVLIGFYGSGSIHQSPTGAESGAGTTVSDNGGIPRGTATPSGSTSAGTVTGSKTGSTANGGGGSVPKSSIMLITPTPGDVWTAETQNPIQWSRAAGVSGQILLLNATTYALVGVIAPSTGPQQTSYTWNTRDLLQSRTSPSKFTVVPGKYVVRISFDGNNLASVTSQPITIVANTSPY